MISITEAQLKELLLYAYEIGQAQATCLLASVTQGKAQNGDPLDVEEWRKAAIRAGEWKAEILKKLERELTKVVGDRSRAAAIIAASLGEVV